MPKTPKSDEPCYTKKSKNGKAYTTCEGAQKKRQKQRAGKKRSKEENAQKAGLKLQKLQIKRNAKRPIKGRIETGPLNPGKITSVAFPPPQGGEKTSTKTTTKDFYKLAANRDKREAHIDEIDKKGRYMKRTLVKMDNLYDSLVNIVEKRGYSFSKPQLVNLRSSVEGYAVDPKYWGYSHSWHISESKGKTDMLIIYMSRHEFGAGATSIRVRKKK